MSYEKRRIMVVEDEAILAQYLKDLLERNGYEVTSVVPFGERAAEVAKIDAPDLVLMDIKLRGEMDGVAAAESIHACQDIPVVFLTAYADEATLERVKGTDAFGYVHKPFKEGDLRSAIELALYRHRMDASLKEREHSYRVLAENLPGIAYRRFPNEGNRTIFFNGNLRPMTGYAPEELPPDQATPVGALILAEDRDQVDRAVCHSQEARAPYGVEYRIRHQDGSIRYFMERGSPLALGDGTRCVDGVIFDVTERRTMEEELSAAYHALERRNDFVESVVSSIESGLVVTDVDFNVTLMNRYALDFLGVAADEARGTLGKFLPEIDALIRQGVHAAEVDLRSVSEDTVVGYSFSTLRGREGEVEGHIISFKDLGEIIRVRRQMRLRERLATMGEVVARVAHEMRNPLFGITSVAQILAIELLMTVQQKELMDSLFGEARRLNRLVDELLDYTKELKLNRSEIDLGALLTECLGLNEIFLADKRIAVEKRFPVGGMQISADAERLKQVFLNLLKNAIDATAVGGEITITVEREGSLASVEIADNGGGIREDIIDKIFDLFYTTKKSGTGLGLSISKKIVETHGGVISAENTGPGATFRVLLPLGASS